MFEAGAYRVHWLAAAPSGARWVADASITDTGSRRLAHRESLLVHLCQSLIALPLVSQVPVAVPGVMVSGGTQLVGNGSLSAINPTASVGDRLRVWSGDVTAGSSSFIDHTHSATGWTSDATALPSGTSPLLNPFRGVFNVRVP